MENSFVDLIYEAALVPEKWRPVLDRLAEMSGAWAGALVAFDEKGLSRSITTETYLPSFEKYMAAPSEYEDNRAIRALAQQYAGFQADWEVMTPDEIENIGMYKKLLRPMGIGWTAGTVIPCPTTECLVFDLANRIETGPFRREMLQRLDLYRPHLARAAMMASRLGMERVQTMAETLSIVGLSAAVLDASGRVLAANHQFEALTPRIRIGARDRISIAAKKANSLLAHVLSTGVSFAQTVSSIPLPAEDDRPALILHLVPIRLAARDFFTGAAFILLAAPVTAPTAPLTELLNGLFDLTPAEARVARSFAAGQSVSDCAVKFALSRETVRTHIKNIMAKTGTTRQAELAQLLSATTPRLDLEP